MKLAAFIGTGNMGGALIRAACRAIGPEQVVITDHQPDKAQALAQELGCTAVATNDEAAQQAQYVFLCVKPQVLPGVLKALGASLPDDRVLVSIAAGVRLADIQADLGRAVPLLRVMPNTCAAIGQGMLALCAGPGAGEAQLADVERILACAGRVERLAEAQIDAFTAVAGCGPAFVDLFIESLADGGVMVGLPRQQALIYAAQTVLGAAALMLESGEHPGALKDAVCSPGGSTIAGVAALERRAFRAAAIEAVLAAFDQNRALGAR